MGIGMLVGSVIFGVIVAGVISPQNQMSHVTVAEQEVAYNRSKVTFVNEALDKYYIETIDEKNLLEGIYRGYVYGLDDANTRYLTADEFTKQQEEAVGNYVGMGIKFAWGITSQHIIITEVVAGSPADKAGIKVGDKIIAIDDTLAMASNETLIYEKVMYSGDKPVVYTVVDNDETNERDVTLQAELVEIELIHSAYLGDGIGYIVLDGLVEGSTQEIAEHVETLKTAGATRLIMDLRGTSSDHIEEALQLCDMFLDTQVAFQVTTNREEPTLYETTEGALDEELLLLTSSYTEGAIEAFVAALQEAGRAQVIGSKTMGNGTVQEEIALGDGSGLIITTGFVKTAAGTAINEEGITPDIDQKKPLEETLALVTTGYVPHDKDAVLQKAIQTFQK